MNNNGGSTVREAVESGNPFRDNEESVMLRSSIQTCVLTAMAATLLAGTAAIAADTTLTIESWRTDDLSIWQEQIIPAFEKSHPASRSSSSRPRRPNIMPR